MEWIRQICLLDIQEFHMLEKVLLWPDPTTAFIIQCYLLLKNIIKHAQFSHDDFPGHVMRHKVLPLPKSILKFNMSAMKISFVNVIAFMVSAL